MVKSQQLTIIDVSMSKPHTSIDIAISCSVLDHKMYEKGNQSQARP